MANINAIKTNYNGYKFRSRLEARWAVFFDKAKIKYEYEPEGFVTKSNGKSNCYLPDFYLPQFDMYVEVKPKREGYEKEIEKVWNSIIWGGEIKKVLILSDIPPYGELGQWFFPIIYYGINGTQSGWWTFIDEYDFEVENEESTYIGCYGYLYKHNDDCIKPIGYDDEKFYCDIEAKSDIQLRETSNDAKTILKYYTEMVDACKNLTELEKWVPHIENPLLFKAFDIARKADFKNGRLE